MLTSTHTGFWRQKRKSQFPKPITKCDFICSQCLNIFKVPNNVTLSTGPWAPHYSAGAAKNIAKMNTKIIILKTLDRKRGNLPLSFHWRFWRFQSAMLY